MDCSGLVYSAYLQHNIALPRTSNDMAMHGEMISTKEAQPGDLIFFMTNGKSVVNHVGLIIEVADDEIKFIHSSTSKGVIISSTLDDYYGKTFAQINRVLNY
ncbi:MAG: C40 family peptidase [Flavobacterium sp.]|nr:C40 family peptidase [Flavobacterium sp.]